MTIAADIDWEQVDRDFGMAVRLQVDADDDHPWGASPPFTPHPTEPAGPGTTAAAALARCAGWGGAAACVVGGAAAVHPVTGLLWATARPDIRYDLLCAGAWLSAGTAGILIAIGFRRA